MDWVMIGVWATFGLVFFGIIFLDFSEVQHAGGMAYGLQDLNSSLQSKASSADLNSLVLALQLQNGAGLQCLQKYAYCQQVQYNANADLNGVPVVAFTETCVLPKGKS